ncbi:MAG: formate dehydrogenase accessory protein FdhE [Deltaproteobacteria bacterium]|nr:formate dehydrogenase accessory protein FdhE [Deltaproteobacteria bacterium]
MEKIKERIAWFKEERPIYREILDFYAQVLEEQGRVRPQLKIRALDLDKKLVKSRQHSGVPLLQREEFEIDLEAAKGLFHALCLIGQGATQKMGEEIPKIVKVLQNDKLNLEHLLSRHYDGDYLDQEAERWGFDMGIFFFLVKASVRPSLEAQMEQLRGSIDLEEWLQRYCPICGSSPQMAELRDEGGKRYLQCSLCGCHWRWERLACPYCHNKAFDSLHYLFSEEEEAYRVDLCDRCKGYIKTVDSRKLDYEPYLDLEDVVTIHLDLLALEKGYKRPVPTPWGPMIVK